MDNDKQHLSLNLPTPVSPDVAQTGSSPASSAHASQNTPVPSSENQNAQPAADDRDIIEQEWIIRTEQLISQYATDPYILSQKMYELRAEYISKRYGKALKQGGQA